MAKVAVDVNLKLLQRVIDTVEMNFTGTRTELYKKVAEEYNKDATIKVTPGVVYTRIYQGEATTTVKPGKKTGGGGKAAMVVDIPLLQSIINQEQAQGWSAQSHFAKRVAEVYNEQSINKITAGVILLRIGSGVVKTTVERGKRGQRTAAKIVDIQPLMDQLKECLEKFKSLGMEDDQVCGNIEQTLCNYL